MILSPNMPPVIPNHKSLITYFSVAPASGDIPAIMPSPFSDVPHPLAEQASLMLQQQLMAKQHGEYDFFLSDAGKMFGVLVVQDSHGLVGYLSAFSGMVGGQFLLPGFVPPVFKQAEYNGFLPQGTKQLAELTEQLKRLESCEQRDECVQNLVDLKQQRDEVLATLKLHHKKAKAVRKQQRLKLEDLLDADEQQTQMRALALASQHHKREAANTKTQWDEKVQACQQALDVFEDKITHVKETRSQLSRTLHDQVFASYVLHNFINEEKPITHFFPDALPPAGTGDCAGPKLIQYAYQQQLKPLALAEFWWGAPSSAGVRHHKQFYPACRGKCRPILPFMLRGLNVEPEPFYGQQIDASEPQIVYEDDDLLVINKPAGLMSEPGKELKDCVFNRLLARFPDCPELRLVHRLDMSTSGLLLVAKNLKVHKLLQKQFIQRSVEKRYEAILSKVLPVECDEGDIDLPLRVDFDDRPRQLVCYEYGKRAQTHWQVIRRNDETTHVYFYPLTGRTHQLRVHASHRDGLDAAIVGDDLYGLPGGRLMLHAQRLCFNHPVSRERLVFEVPACFETRA